MVLFPVSSVIFSFPIQLPLLIAAPDGFTLVVTLFAPGQCQAEFGLAGLEIEPQRNERIPLFIDLAIELF